MTIGKKDLEDFIIWRKETKKITKAQAKKELEDFIIWRKDITFDDEYEFIPDTKKEQWFNDDETYDPNEYSASDFKPERTNRTFDIWLNNKGFSKSKTMDYNGLKDKVWSYFEVQENPKNSMVAQALLKRLIQ